MNQKGLSFGASRGLNCPKCLRLHCLNVFSTVFSTGFPTTSGTQESVAFSTLSDLRYRFFPEHRSAPQNRRFFTAQVHQRARLAARRPTRIEHEIRL